MVRVWLEDLGDGKTEWRGKVQHVLSGQVHYFRDWPMLEKLLLEMLDVLKRDGD
jgi:hypothetical protein